MRRFTVSTEGRRDLNMRALAESFVNQLWTPDHLTPEQAANFAHDSFRRTVLAELKMLTIAHVDLAHAHDPK